MRLSWNEIRVRAAGFAQEWAGEGYEKGQTQLFYRDFFDIFGVPVRRVASFEQPVTLLGDKRGFIDLFWKGVLLVEQKSAGRDLAQAKTQALSYFPGLKDTDLPRYILLSDFATFELYDLDEDDHVFFTLADLPQHVEKFGFHPRRPKAHLPRPGSGQHRSIRARRSTSRRAGRLRLHRPRSRTVPRPHCFLSVRR